MCVNSLVVARSTDNGDGLVQHYLVGAVSVEVHTGHEGSLRGMSLPMRGGEKINHKQLLAELKFALAQSGESQTGKIKAPVVPQNSWNRGKPKLVRGSHFSHIPLEPRVAFKGQQRR